VQTITGHVHAPFDRIPLGRPDHNVHTYVVLPDTPEAEADAAAAEAEQQQPSKWRLAAVGEPGELWLSGPRLARGYRNRPEQTAAAYVPNPWFEASTAALVQCSGSDPAAAALREHYRLAYRTSDLVVMGADGQVNVMFNDASMNQYSVLLPCTCMVWFLCS
jgi:non-ribosomal peptide synthetase component F